MRAWIAKITSRVSDISRLCLSAPKFWRRIGVLAALLYPISLIYGCVVAIRRWYYQHLAPPAVLRHSLIKHGAKVLVIGNLTVGGVGKTPLVAHVAELFNHNGYQTAIVMRGYQGKADHYPYVVDSASTPASAGDEACMLFRMTGLTVVVDPDRARAVSYLLDQGYKIIVSDDGLQHYRLPRQGEIVVFNAEYGFGNGLLLPAGPLREPAWQRLRSVDWLVANCNCGNYYIPDSYFAGKTVYSMRVVPRYLVNLLQSDLKQAVERWNGVSVVAVAAIGCPEKFFQTLETLGMVIVKCFSYPDHYQFKQDDYAVWGANLVVMTSKDVIKVINPPRNFWYLEIGLDVAPELEAQLLSWAASRA